MRKINILSTLVGNRQVQSSAVLFAELFTDLQNLGLDIESYKYVVGKTTEGPAGFTLELPTAELPKGDFTLVVTPLKTKAGADYREMKAFVKQARENAITNDDSDVIEILDTYGNYTQLNTADMTELYDELMEHFDEVEEPEELVDESEIITRLQERVTALEIAANIVTPENKSAFFASKTEEVLTTINQL